MPRSRERVDCRARVIAAANQSKMRDIAEWGSQSALSDSEDERVETGERLPGVDFVVPQGFHLHIIDDEETFYPAEGLSTLGGLDYCGESRAEALADDQIVVSFARH